MTDTVILREVGLRDGLQIATCYPSTAGKARWIAAEYAAGVRQFEAGSFLRPESAPAFADIDQVIAILADLPGVWQAALTLNRQGAERALARPVDEMICVLSASETHNRRNVRRTQTESLALIAEICRMRDQAPRRPRVNVGIAMAFGCSIEGRVEPAVVLRLAEAAFAAGADLVSLADTAGVAGPRQVASLARALRQLGGDRPFGVHLHDTRGTGLANAAAALDQGVAILDASLGGLGGCPFAPGATGNIVMEDLAYLAATMGFATGIDLARLIAVRQILAEEMPGEPTHGGLARAGLPPGHEAAA